MAGITRETVETLEQQLAAERSRADSLQRQLDDRSSYAPEMGSLTGKGFDCRPIIHGMVEGELQALKLWRFEVTGKRTVVERENGHSKGRRVEIEGPFVVRAPEETEAIRMFTLTDKNGKPRNKPLDPSQWNFKAKCLGTCLPKNPDASVCC